MIIKIKINSKIQNPNKTMSSTRGSTKGGRGKPKSSKSVSRSQKVRLQFPLGLRRMKKMMRKQTLIPTTTSRASLPVVATLTLTQTRKPPKPQTLKTLIKTTPPFAPSP